MEEYFARAAPKWSCVPRSSEPAREARARAWERVLGGCLVPFTRAAWASAAEEAVERLVTFSEMVLPKSTKDSFYTYNLEGEFRKDVRDLDNRRIHLRRCNYAKR